ncbi:AAA family ATPase [Dactylosporangium sp. NPDC006015]|uniref:AAA family ATPase n=1 Tax=Dactylosporangium sp. NPDC006015 TaxID=3154576 RepID=UPI0033A82FA9
MTYQMPPFPGTEEATLADLIDSDFPEFLRRAERLYDGADNQGRKAPTYEELVWRQYMREKATHKAREKFRDEQAVGDLDSLRAALYDRSKLGNIPRPEQLIDRILTRGSYAVLAGKNQSMKSFLAIGWSLSIATGRPWLDRYDVPRAGNVLYVAAEGASGLDERITAWEVANNGGRPVEPDHFHLFAQAANISKATHAKHLADVATDVGADLVVIDTLRRCTAGLDEDSNTQMSPVLTGFADQIRERSGATTLYVHHTGHAGERSRGASCIEDDADAVWKIARVGESRDRKLDQTKSKDAQKLDDITLTFTAVNGTRSGHLAQGHGEGLWHYVNGFGAEGVPLKKLAAFLGKNEDATRKLANTRITQGVLVKREQGRNVFYTANPAARVAQHSENAYQEDGISHE